MLVTSAYRLSCSSRQAGQPSRRCALVASLASVAISGSCRQDPLSYATERRPGEMWVPRTRVGCRTRGPAPDTPRLFSQCESPRGGTAASTAEAVVLLPRHAQALTLVLEQGAVVLPAVALAVALDHSDAVGAEERPGAGARLRPERLVLELDRVRSGPDEEDAVAERRVGERGVCSRERGEEQLERAVGEL